MNNKIEKALTDLSEGRMIIITDDESRENEGDLVMDAAMVNDQSIAFMVREGKGLVCVPITRDTAARLLLHPMVETNQDRHGTAFTVSVDASDCTTGISAAERAHTITVLARPDSQPNELKRPGHLFPLIAKDGGVLTRRGHTEASCDMVRLARQGTPNACIEPSAVICEILNNDGTMARKDDITAFASRHNLSSISIEEIAQYRKKKGRDRIEAVTTTILPTRWGTFTLHAFRDLQNNKEHIALSLGDIKNPEPLLCRIHSECLTGDTLGSLKCDCGEQYAEAMRRISTEGRGLLVYLRQEGRDIGLLNKIRAYALQDKGLDTVDANLALGFADDEREYGAAAAILKSLSVSSVRLLTNNPDKAKGLEREGILVAAQEHIELPAKPENIRYLQTKVRRMGHTLTTVLKETDFAHS